MKKEHDIRNVHVERDTMILSIDGVICRYELKSLSPILLIASAEERNTYEISPSGYGIHWPLVDEDISIDGLLGVVHHPKNGTKAA
jgi:Protein of unknown function (DUF2442)